VWAGSIATLTRYISDLQQLATECIRKGEADSVFLKHNVFPQHKRWWFARFYPDNLATVYREARKKMGL
jgi:hypothetical protein